MKVFILLFVLAFPWDTFSVSLRPRVFKNLEDPDFSLNTQSIGKDDGGKAKSGPLTEKCGKTLLNLKHGSHGFIESPNYPNKYPPGVDCEWALKAESGTIIHATIFDLRTQSNLLSDVTDSLYVSLSGTWNDTQRFSGDLNAVTPLTLLTEEHELSIRFISSQFGGNQRGFRIGYFADARSSQKPAATEAGDDVLAVTCNYIPVSTPAIFPDDGQSKFKKCEHRSRPGRTYDDGPKTPFLVALALDETHFCSGTLISKNHVLTSAHCTHGVQKIGLIFGADDLDIDDELVQRRIENSSAITTHPGFTPATGLNDISIIKLSKPIEFTEYVQPARLPSWDMIAHGLIGYEVTVHGWGEKFGKIIPKASNNEVRLAPNAACRSSLYKGLTGQMMCVHKENTACTIDSGSPVTTRCKPQGIVPSEPEGSNPTSPSDEPTDETCDEPTDEACDEPTDEACDEPTDEACDEPTDEACDELTDEGCDEPTDEEEEGNEEENEENEEEEEGNEEENEENEEEEEGNEEENEENEEEEEGNEEENEENEEEEEGNEEENEEYEEENEENEEEEEGNEEENEENEEEGEGNEEENEENEEEEEGNEEENEENEEENEENEEEEEGNEEENEENEEEEEGNEEENEENEEEEEGNEEENEENEEEEEGNEEENEENEEEGEENEEENEENEEENEENEEEEEGNEEEEEGNEEENEENEEEEEGNEEEEEENEENHKSALKIQDASTKLETQIPDPNNKYNTECLTDGSNVVLGFMSFGDCSKGYAFTRIAAHLDFISRTIGEWYIEI